MHWDKVEIRLFGVKIEDIKPFEYIRKEKMEYRLIIAGGRDFKDYKLLKKEVAEFLCVLQQPFPEIIQGGQISKPSTSPEHWNKELWYGADWLGLKYAKERGLKWKQFDADWKQFGKSAGPLRNGTMGEYAAEVKGACIVFWNGTSRGTENMIEYARMYELKLKIVNY